MFEHKTSIAPIRRLPVKLLSRIFASHQELIGYNKTSKSSVLSNYVLMLVCKLWCKMGINTPQLSRHYAVELNEIGLSSLDAGITRAGNQDCHLAVIQDWESIDFP